MGCSLALVTFQRGELLFLLLLLPLLLTVANASNLSSSSATMLTSNEPSTAAPTSLSTARTVWAVTTANTTKVDCKPGSNIITCSAEYSGSSNHYKVRFDVSCTGQMDVKATCTFDVSKTSNDSYEMECHGGTNLSCLLNAVAFSSGLDHRSSTDLSCSDNSYVNCSSFCWNYTSCVLNCNCSYEDVFLDSVVQYAKPEISMVDKYVSFVTYCIGFPGNIVSFIVWIQRRMRHSSGFYLAALAMDDFMFLSLHVIFEMHTVWQYKTLNTPVFCQVFPVIFMTAQYLGPLLVLGFTTERYISICHPFKREKYCTVRRAKIVVGLLVALSLSLSAVQGYYYAYTTAEDGSNDCGPRDIVARGGSTSLLIIWNLSIEILIFGLVPLAILILNICVIIEMRRISRMESVTLHHGHSQRTSATTVMLLAVSFYLILTVLPVTIVYTLYYEFEIPSTLPGPLREIVKDPKVQRHINFWFFLTCIREIGITHYAFNIIIYVTTGKFFRKELKRLVVKGLCGKVSMSISKEYSSLRSSLKRESSHMPMGGGKTMYVSVNGHSTNATTITTTAVAAEPHYIPPPTPTTIVSEPDKPDKAAPTSAATITPMTTTTKVTTDNDIDTSETNV